MIMEIFRAMFPPKCPVCRNISREGKKGVCPKCREEFDSLYHPVGVFSVKNAKQCTALFPYENESVRKVIFRLKNISPRPLIHFAAGYLARAVLEDGSLASAAAVTYVPRRRAAVRTNGVDQARLLAEELARLCGKPCKQLLKVTRRSKRQHSLNSSERRRNVRGLYIGEEAVPSGGVILIDDIVTTGATVSEAARQLKACGADRVYVLSFAH